MSNVRDFGTVGDGTTDDTQAIQHAINDGDGVVHFPRGNYRISRTLTVDLAERGRTSLQGNGGVAKLLMHGKGPAIFLKATHGKTADPGSFRPDEWLRERMPMVRDLEIEGAHDEADGIRIQGVMQPTLTGVLIRRVRTAVHITERARNLLISHCHIYHNTGVGVHVDRANVHQAIISGSHISYCRLGGIRIDGGEIRNLQITGNDIEYNNAKSHGNAANQPTADIYIDVGEGSIREGTIASNTIQSTYSPGGANIRFIGSREAGDHRAGMWTISGNLIGSQNNNIHVTSARGIAIAGNYIYSGHHRNVLVEGSRNIVLGANCFGHNPDYKKNELATGIRFVDCRNCNITGVLIEDAEAGKHTVPDVVPIERNGLLELVRCRRVSISGTQVLSGTPYGIYLDECSDTLISGSTVIDERDAKKMRAAILWEGPGRGNMITACRLGAGTEKTLDVADHVRLSENLLDDGQANGR